MGVPQRGDVTASDDVTALDSIKIQSRLSEKVPARERPGQRNAKVGNTHPSPPHFSALLALSLLSLSSALFVVAVSRLQRPGSS